STPHSYESQPWDWFVISRPVSFFWQEYTDPAGLHVETQSNVGGPYAREVLAIGNPAIWWLSLPAIAVCLIWWATRRDWRGGSGGRGRRCWVSSPDGRPGCRSSRGPSSTTTPWNSSRSSSSASSSAWG